MAQYIGALDQGTSSTRFILFDRAGHIIATSQKEHRQIYPQPGWVEHDAMEIWRNTQGVIEGAMKRAGLKKGDLAAIGITNQRETTVLWDRQTGEPLAPALVWQDTRTAELCARLAGKGGQDRFRLTTGLPLSTYFSGPKIAWLLQNLPAAAAAAARGDLIFGTMDTWLCWKMTEGKVHATDVTNASRTMLMDLRRLAWDQEILAEFGIPAAILPAIHPSSCLFGDAKTPKAIAGVPITGMLGDQQAALTGQTCFAPGQAKNTYGTGCFMLLNTGEKLRHSRHGLLTTVGYQWQGEPPVYALEGSVAIAGALVQWLRDNLGLINSSSEIESLAASVADNAVFISCPLFPDCMRPIGGQMRAG